MAGNGDTMGNPCINDLGDVVFIHYSSQALIHGNVTVASGPILATLASAFDPSQDIATFGPRTDVNNLGEVAYGCTLNSTSASQIRKYHLVTGSQCVVDTTSGTAPKNFFTLAINRPGFVG